MSWGHKPWAISTRRALSLSLFLSICVSLSLHPSRPPVNPNPNPPIIGQSVCLLNVEVVWCLGVCVGAWSVPRKFKVEGLEVILKDPTAFQS